MNTIKRAKVKRRKHRLVLTVTFSHPVTANKAVQGANQMFERLDLNGAPVWLSRPDTYIDKLRATKKSW